MLDWLSWAEVLEALQIKDSELLELFQKGLQLYKLQTVRQGKDLLSR
jgi:hypothetical protein